MLRALLSLAAMVSTSMAVTGCVDNREYAPSPTSSSDGVATQNGDTADLGTQINVTNGHVAGDIGAVRSFDAPADQVDAWYDGVWKSTSITLTANDPRGRMGMVILNVDGVDLRAVPAGSYPFTTQSVDPAVDGGYVSVTGCSSDPSSYYDEQGEEGTITITDQPAGRTVDVQARLPVVNDDGTATGEHTAATGSFTLH